jgi:hypothetical protein
MKIAAPAEGGNDAAAGETKGDGVAGREERVGIEIPDEMTGRDDRMR